MKTNRRKKLGIFLAVAAVLVIAAAIIVPKLIDLNNYRDLIAQGIEDALGGEAKLGRIRWGIGKDLWVEMDGFSISGSTLLQGDLKLARIYAEISTLPLLSKKIVVEELKLESPDAIVRLEPAPEKENPAEEELPRYEPIPVAAPKALPVEIVIEKVSLKNGKITVEDAMTLPGHPMIRRFSDVEINATDLAPGKKTMFRLSLRDEADSGLGTLTAQGTFSGLTEALTLKTPELKLKVNLSSFNIDVIRPYVKDYEWVQGLRGSAAIGLSIESHLGGDFQSSGIIDLSRTVFEDPSSGQVVQPEAGTQMAYRIALSENRLTVQDVDLRWANLSLKTAAVLDDLRADPTLRDFTLTAKLPLQELTHIMPWKKLGPQADRLREILSGGGHVTIEEASIPDIKISVLTEKPETLLSGIRLNARISDISASTLPELPTIQEVGGTIRLANGVVTVEDLKGRVGTATLPPISAVVANLMDAPEIQAQVTGPLVVTGLTDEKMIKLLRPAGINKMAGAADLNVSLKLATAKPEDLQLEGTIELRGFSLGTSFTPAFFEDIHLKAAVSGDTVDVSEADLMITLPEAGKSPERQFKVALSGKVSDLRKQPKVSLRRLKTAPIHLSSLASVVPWDAFGKESEKIKQVFLLGGTVSVEELLMPSIDLTSPPKDLASLAERSSAMIQVANINIKHAPGIPGLEDITGLVSLKKGVLNAEKISLRHGAIALPDLNLHATHLFAQPKVDARLKGHIQIGKSPMPKFEELLLEYGFKNATGDADVDLKATYDHAKPDQWTAEGTLAVKDLNAVSHPEGVVLGKFNADLSFKREKRLEIDIRKLSTQLNGSPVNVEGRLSLENVDTFLIDVKAQAKNLNLIHLVAVSPILRALDLDLKGSVNLDVNIHLPSRNPAANKMTGTITTHGIGFKLSDPPLIIKDGNSRLEFAGDTVFFRSMTASVNDQKLSLEGKTIRPLLEPNAHLKITSPDLDLDKLLPPSSKKADDAKTPPSDPQDLKDKNADVKKSASKKVKTEQKKLPFDWDRTVAQIQVEIAKLRFRGNTFHNVRYTTDYHRGVLKHYELKAAYGKSDIQADGMLDLRNPASIDFEINPNIQELPIQAVESLLGIEKKPAQGPLSVSGNIKGRTGSTPELLTSLSGRLEAVVGKGTYLETGATTDLLSKILTVTNIRSILTGGILRDITSRGIPFDQIKAGIALGDGKLDINTFQFLSSAMNLSAQGSINLLEKNLNVDVQLEPFEVVDKALGLVPIAGKLGQVFTRYNVSVSGAVDHPKIQMGAVRKETAAESQK